MWKRKKLTRAEKLKIRAKSAERRLYGGADGQRPAIDFAVDVAESEPVSERATAQIAEIGKMLKARAMPEDKVRAALLRLSDAVRTADRASRHIKRCQYRPKQLSRLLKTASAALMAANAAPCQGRLRASGGWWLCDKCGRASGRVMENSAEAPPKRLSSSAV